MEHPQSNLKGKISGIKKLVARDKLKPKFEIGSEIYKKFQLHRLDERPRISQN